MRNGKDQTYKIPILVSFVNNYLRGLKHLKETNFFEVAYNDHEAKIRRSQYKEAVKCSTFGMLSNQKLHIKIPKSSYYRVVHQLVSDKYLQKCAFTTFMNQNTFCITIKGFLFVIK